MPAIARERIASHRIVVAMFAERDPQPSRVLARTGSFQPGRMKWQV
jgi:hypothetical protein